MEKYSGAFGLNLNKTKGIAISTKTQVEIKFVNGDKMPAEKSAEYLGSQLNYKADTDAEVKRRIQAANATWQRLKPFWLNDRISTKYKIIVYDAVIRSKVVYGLESARLTPALKNTLVGFQMRGIRRILQKKHPFWDRQNSHAHMIRLANEKAHTNTDKQIMLLTEYILDSSCKLLGHIIRATNSDPLRQPTLRPGSARPHVPEVRRVGRPRTHWVESTMEHVWDTLEDMRLQEDDVENLWGEFDPNNVDHCEWIGNLAQARII